MKEYIRQIIKILDEACEKESLDDYLILLEDTSKEVNDRLNFFDDPKAYEKYYGV